MIRLAPPSLMLLMLGLAGCSRPAITEDDDHPFEPEVGSGIGFHMVNAGFWTNGVLRSDRITLSSENFTMLFVRLPESGLYVVTVEETEESHLSGRFSGTDLTFTGGRTEIRFESEGDHLFDDHIDREAWVEFIPSEQIPEDAPNANLAVVGLARDRGQIPGL